MKEMKKLKTIEQVAKLLIQKKVSFNYTPTSIKINDFGFNIFYTVTYHVERKILIFMDDNYDGVNINDVIKAL